MIGYSLGTLDSHDEWLDLLLQGLVKPSRSASSVHTATASATATHRRAGCTTPAASQETHDEWLQKMASQRTRVQTLVTPELEEEVETSKWDRLFVRLMTAYRK